MANARLAVIVGQHGFLDADRLADLARAPGGPVLHPMGVMGAPAGAPRFASEDEMSADHVQLEGPDLSLGVKLSAIPDGAMLSGHVGDQPVLLVRRGDELFAVGAKCPHYGGPLAEGVVVGETIRCPWHHACFSLRSGEVLRAPARDPLPRWRVEVSDGIAYARERIEREPRPTLGSTRVARIRRDHRRRPGRKHGCRNASRRRLCRADHDAERRCGAARRSAQPVQGLSGRPGAGGMGVAEVRRLLPGERNRRPAEHARGADRHRTICGRTRRREPSKLRRASACHRRRAGQARRSGRATSIMFIICARSTTAARCLQRPQRPARR